MCLVKEVILQLPRKSAKCSERWVRFNLNLIYRTESMNFWLGLSYVIRKDLLWSEASNGRWAQIFRFTRVKLTTPPPFETARVLSYLYTFQCGQWAPIQNSQIIGRYKEITAHRPSVKWSIKWQVSSNFQIYLGKTDGPPHLKLPECWVNSTLYNAVNEHPFETVK